MKVYPFKIPKKPKENIVLQVDRGPSFYDKLHQHEEIQLSLVVLGKGKLVVGNSVTTFETGEFIAIGSNLPHLFLSSKDAPQSHMVSLFFTKESFGTTFFDNPELQDLHPFWGRLPYGFKYLDKNQFIRKLFFELRNENKFQLFMGLMELLLHLVEIEYEPIVQTPYTIKISKNQGERLQLAIDHALQNFQSEIKLDDVASKIHMGTNSFCRFFKQRTNKTFFEFLAEVRIQHACELMDKNQETPISEIAVQSGYNTISNFNRQFLQITKMNPTQYRSRFEKDI